MHLGLHPGGPRFGSLAQVAAAWKSIAKHRTLFRTNPGHSSPRGLFASRQPTPSTSSAWNSWSAETAATPSLKLTPCSRESRISEGRLQETSGRFLQEEWRERYSVAGTGKEKRSETCSAAPSKVRQLLRLSNGNCAYRKKVVRVLRPRPCRSCLI